MSSDPWHRAGAGAPAGDPGGLRRHGPRYHERVKKRAAWWTWAGLLLVAAAVGLGMAGTRFGRLYLTPLAWTGIILALDGLLALRGQSWFVRRPRALLVMAVVSVPSWLLFELYDRPRFWRPGGPELWWHYHGLPPWPERGIGYLWSFATITPALLLAAHLLAPAARRLAGRGSGGRTPTEVLWAVSAVGLMLAAVPLLWPSPYFGGDGWVAWALLRDPLNRLRGRPSLIGDLEAGERSRPLALLAAGLLAGPVWEGLNWLAGARWSYTVPFAGHLKLFEMPVLGYLGFAPFALECFAIWSFLAGGTLKGVEIDWTEATP